MAAGTMMVSGYGRNLNPEDAGNPPKTQKIAVLAFWVQARS